MSLAGAGIDSCSEIKKGREKFIISSVRLHFPFPSLLPLIVLPDHSPCYLFLRGSSFESLNPSSQAELERYRSPSRERAHHTAHSRRRVSVFSVVLVFSVLTAVPSPPEILSSHGLLASSLAVRRNSAFRCKAPQTSLTATGKIPGLNHQTMMTAMRRVVDIERRIAGRRTISMLAVPRGG